MRRSLITCCALFACLVCLPAQADANFWVWVDKMSGPRFKGWQVQWQVWCQYADATTDGNEVRVSGVMVSVCRSEAGERTKRFLALNVKGGDNARDDEFSEAARALGALSGENVDNKVTSLGVTFHTVARDWLAIGSGGGVAWFSSNHADSFTKFYIEPYIVDYKPFAVKKAAEDWRAHLLVLRLSGLVFPSGFEPGRFQPGGPRYPAEFTHQLTIHSDLEPLVRCVAGTWSKDPCRGQVEVTGGGARFSGHGWGEFGSFALRNSHVGFESDLGGSKTLLQYSGNVIARTFTELTHEQLIAYGAAGIGGLHVSDRLDVGNTARQSFVTGNAGGGVKWFPWQVAGFRIDYRFVKAIKGDAPTDGRQWHRVYVGAVARIGGTP